MVFWDRVFQRLLYRKIPLDRFSLEIGRTESFSRLGSTKPFNAAQRPCRAANAFGHTQFLRVGHGLRQVSVICRYELLAGLPAAFSLVDKILLAICFLIYMTGDYLQPKPGKIIDIYVLHVQIILHSLLVQARTTECRGVVIWEQLLVLQLNLHLFCILIRKN